MIDTNIATAYNKSDMVAVHLEQIYPMVPAIGYFFMDKK